MRQVGGPLRLYGDLLMKLDNLLILLFLGVLPLMANELPSDSQRAEVVKEGPNPEPPKEEAPPELEEQPEPPKEEAPPELEEQPEPPKEEAPPELEEQPEPPKEEAPPELEEQPEPPKEEAPPELEEQPEPPKEEAPPELEEQPEPPKEEAPPELEEQPEPPKEEAPPELEEQPEPPKEEAPPELEEQPEPPKEEAPPELEEQPEPPKEEAPPELEEQPEPPKEETPPELEEQLLGEREEKKDEDGPPPSDTHQQKDNLQENQINNAIEMLNSLEINPQETYAPPTYLIKGRGLVYDCLKGRWACVDRASYFQCARNQKSLLSQRKNPSCILNDIYYSPIHCARGQLAKIHKSMTPRECQSH